MRGMPAESILPVHFGVLGLQRLAAPRIPSQELSFPHKNFLLNRGGEDFSHRELMGPALKRAREQLIGGVEGLSNERRLEWTTTVPAVRLAKFNFTGRAGH